MSGPREAVDSTSRMRQEMPVIVVLIKPLIYCDRSIVRFPTLKLVIVHTAAPESA